MRYLSRWLIPVLLAGLLAGPAFAGADQLQALLSSAERAEADRGRDQRDKAGELLALLNLKDGDQVLDVFAGGGYWSELFAAAVGDQGQVLVHNNAAYKKFVGPNVHLRFQAKPLPQVQLYDREVADLGLAAASQDLIFMSLSFHDLYFVDPDSWPAIDEAAFIGQLKAALKPGGRLVIVDHEALAGTGASAAQTLHRIDRQFVIDRMAHYGLTLQLQSGLLENQTDDLSKSVFDPAVRGKTRRFVLVFSR